MKAKERPGPATVLAPATNGSHADASGVRAAALAWEDWFQQATNAQQVEALALAQRQGFVFAHQLPAPANGAKSHGPAEPADGLDLLRVVLAGKTDRLLPPTPRCGDMDASRLTSMQRQAVSRLTASPDVALLRAKPSDAVGVLAEIVAQAARAGQRVLLVTQQTAKLDQIVQRLHGCDAVLPVRFLDPGEATAQLSPAVRSATLQAQRELFQSSTLVKAQAVRADSEARCQRRQKDEALWPALASLAQRHASLTEKQHTLRQRITDTPADVRREAEGIPNTGKTLPSGPFALQIVELIRGFNDAWAVLEAAESKLQEEQAQGHGRLAQVEQERAVLEPLVQAKRQGRWWTGAWWRATFSSDLTARVQQCDQRLAEARAAVDKNASDAAQLALQQQGLQAKLADDRARLVEGESGRRQAAWQAQVVELEHEAAPILREWATLCGTLDPELVPAEPTPAAVAAAEARWQDARRQDEAACRFARQWASFLQESAPHFVAQLPRYASLLAGTANALIKNVEFAAFADGPFDLVILDDADRLLENDLLRLARKGRRWLLATQAAPAGNGRPCSFDKLWQTLHADPSRLTYRWTKEAQRWCCELRPVAAKDRRYLESERLADFPEIELRILAVPRTQPHLAQVVFPASMSLGQGKQFIYRELQEAAVQPPGRLAWLEETDHSWCLHLGPPASSELIAVELEAGIREWASAHGPTHRIEFDKSVCQRPQVEDWLKRNLNLHDLGRTFEIC